MTLDLQQTVLVGAVAWLGLGALVALLFGRWARGGRS